MSLLLLLFIIIIIPNCKYDQLIIVLTSNLLYDLEESEGDEDCGNQGGENLDCGGIAGAVGVAGSASIDSGGIFAVGLNVGTLSYKGGNRGNSGKEGKIGIVVIILFNFFFF